MQNFNYKSIITTFSIIAIALAVYFLPISLTASLPLNGKVVPSQEWTLQRNDNGVIKTVLRNFESGITESESVFQPARDDLFQLKIRSFIVNGKEVAQNDTLAELESSNLIYELAQVQQEIVVAEANLKSLKLGQSKAVQDAAAAKLQLAESIYEYNQIELKRIQKLFDNDIFTEEILYDQLDETRRSELQIEVEKAKLRSTMNDVDPAAFSVWEANLKSAKAKKDVLKNRLSEQYILSPINGIIYSEPVGDTLFSIVNTKKSIIYIPLPYTFKKYFEVNKKINVNLHNRSTIVATISSVREKIQYLNGKPIVFISAILEKSPSENIWGMILNCTFEKQTETFWEYIKIKWLNIY